MAVTNMSDIVNPEVMGPMIDAKIDSLAKITPYAKVDTSLVGVAGDTKTIPCWNYIGDAEDVAEGVEITPAKLTATSTKFTVKKAMKSVSVTQEAINSGHGNPVGQAEIQLAKSIMGKVDNDVLEAAYKSKNIFDGSADVINYNGIVSANGKFEDEEDEIEKVMFIHPNQETQMLLDPNFLSADRFTEGVAVRGAIGKCAGCWIKKSKKVQIKSGNYLCPIIKCEPDSAETEYTEDELPALTILLKKDTQVDHEYFPKKQIHDITATKYYGVALTNESKIVVAKFKSQPSA